VAIPPPRQKGEQMISDRAVEQFKEYFNSYHNGEIDVYDLVDYLEQVINEEEEN
jgi:hypothetical protein